MDTKVRVLYEFRIGPLACGLVPTRFNMTVERREGGKSPPF